MVSAVGLETTATAASCSSGRDGWEWVLAVCPLRQVQNVAEKCWPHAVDPSAALVEGMRGRWKESSGGGFFRWATGYYVHQYRR